MKHFNVEPDDIDAGHYACGRGGDDEYILVQIGERAGGAQTRLVLTPVEALRFATDLIKVGQNPGWDHHTYGEGGAWLISERCRKVTVTFDDDPRHHETMGKTVCPGGAERRATLEMSPLDALRFGRFILARTADVLDRLHGEPWTLGDKYTPTAGEIA